MSIKNEKLQVLRDQVMPEVKKLVKKYGRSIVSGCLMKLADYEKKMKELSAKKKEVASLEKELNK